MNAAEKPAATELPGLEHVPVADAMRYDIFRCSLDATLRRRQDHGSASCARDRRDGHRRRLRVGDPVRRVAARGLLGFDGGKRYRRDMADRDFSTLSSDEPVMVADELMRERGVGHMLVQHARGGRLTGMLSSLDIAGILAGGQT